MVRPATMPVPAQRFRSPAKPRRRRCECRGTLRGFVRCNDSLGGAAISDPARAAECGGVRTCTAKQAPRCEPEQQAPRCERELPHREASAVEYGGASPRCAGEQAPRCKPKSTQPPHHSPVDRPTLIRPVYMSANPRRSKSIDRASYSAVSSQPQVDEFHRRSLVALGARRSAERFLAAPFRRRPVGWTLRRTLRRPLFRCAATARPPRLAPLLAPFHGTPPSFTVQDVETTTRRTRRATRRRARRARPRRQCRRRSAVRSRAARIATNARTPRPRRRRCATRRDAPGAAGAR